MIGFLKHLFTKSEPKVPYQADYISSIPAPPVLVNFSIPESPAYVQFAFHACFYELLNIDNSYWKTKLDRTEIFRLLEYMEINVDKALLTKKYFDQHNHDFEIFHSMDDETVFAAFDLQKGMTDQNDMFYLGISCKKKHEDTVMNLLNEIHNLLDTTSPFLFGIYNTSEYQRNINHHYIPSSN